MADKFNLANLSFPDLNIQDQNLNFNTAVDNRRKFIGNGTDAAVGYPYGQPQFIASNLSLLAIAETPDGYAKGAVAGNAAELDRSNRPDLAAAVDQSKLSVATKVTAPVAAIQSKSAAALGQGIRSKSATALRFPANLGNGTSGNIFPFIQFVAKVKTEGNYAVFLPIPSGLTFSDNMQYSSLDLGIMGSIVSKAVGAAVNQSNLFSGVGAGIGAGVGTIVNQIKSTNAAAAASIATRFVGSDNLANAVDFGARQVIAPNTNTAFQNSGVRQFQFSFKMMPKDQKEADTITQIVRLFRQNMYPAANDLILTYPPVWNIDFFDGSTSKKNTKLPGIHTCYLIAMSAVYNSSGNMFHADGHPVETDVQLTFEETRALTLSDIVELSEGRNA